MRLGLEQMGAVVRWAAMCLVTPGGDGAPGGADEGGADEVVRRRGRRDVARSLAYFAH